MNDEWMQVYSANDLYKVDLVKGMLLENGIASEILDRQDSAFLTGEVELFVHTSDFEAAKKLIAERREIE